MLSLDFNRNWRLAQIGGQTWGELDVNGAKLFTLRAPAEAIGRTEATTIGEPVRSVSPGIDGL